MKTGTRFTYPGGMEALQAELTWVIDYASAGNRTHDRLIESPTAKLLRNRDTLILALCQGFRSHF